MFYFSGRGVGSGWVQNFSNGCATLKAQNHLELNWKILLSCERCWKPSYNELWKSCFGCNHSTCKNLRSQYPKIALFCTFLTKPPIQKFWSLVYTFLGWISSNLMWEFEKFYFFRILWTKNCPKMAAILVFKALMSYFFIENLSK